MIYSEEVLAMLTFCVYGNKTQIVCVSHSVRNKVVPLRLLR